MLKFRCVWLDMQRAYFGLFNIAALPPAQMKVIRALRYAATHPFASFIWDLDDE
jgi:hypothetical protein